MVLSLLFHTFLVSALASPHVLHERRTVPLQARDSVRVGPDTIIPIRIGLKQRNLDNGYDRLMEVSHPDSPNYGKHLSKQEVHDLFAPLDETIDTVKAWLTSSGIEEAEILHYENKGWLAIDIPAGKAEQLLSTEYYEHNTGSETRIGCHEYYLPAHVSSHVDFIKPGVALSPPLKKHNLDAQRFRKRTSDGKSGNTKLHRHISRAASDVEDSQDCSQNMTIPCIKALYSIPNGRLHDPANVMGVYQEGYEAFSISDLQLYFARFAPWVPQGTRPKVLSIDGGRATKLKQFNSDAPEGDNRDTSEANLDLDLLYALVYPQNVTLYEVDDIPQATNKSLRGFLNTFLDAIDGSYCNYSAYGLTGDSPGIDPSYPDPLDGGYKRPEMCGTFNLTRVLSISYGQSESDTPRAYMQRMCDEFMKLALQGHTIVLASGDYGVAADPTNHANTNKNGCLSGSEQNATIYNPQTPTCPYVTAVGGTRLYDGQTTQNAESALQLNATSFFIQGGGNVSKIDPTLLAGAAFFASAGGFSNIFPTADYQKDAVENYLTRYASQIPSYAINDNGTNIGEGGGLFNRLGRAYPDISANGARQTFYVDGDIFVTDGTSLSAPIVAAMINLINEERTAVGKGPVGFINPVLYQHPEVFNDITNGSNPNCGTSGFPASPGWDAVTGLGTPKYPDLLKVFLDLP